MRFSPMGQGEFHQNPVPGCVSPGKCGRIFDTYEWVAHSPRLEQQGYNSYKSVAGTDYIKLTVRSTTELYLQDGHF